MSEFPKKFSPKEFESEVYKNWESNNHFSPKNNPDAPAFFLPMPPPNVTSVLHVGHSTMITLQDIMVRYHRMQGYDTLLLPGTDHAGISTQVKVEQQLRKDGINPDALTREEFLQACWKWNDFYGGKIQNQFRSMGASADWTREKFTLDEDMNERVIDAFNILYEKGLIYQGEYMVNYDPGLKTVVSDQEVVYKEEKGHLYHITYFVSGSDNQIVIATTRPETMLGDVAVAVHPKDKRYKKLLRGNKKLILPILNKEIPLIADEMVDMEFGTGAVKITPAHDANDFEVAKRHNLPVDVVVIGREGTMVNVPKEFLGQDYMTARHNVVSTLKAKGNLNAIEPHTSKVGYGERSGVKIETIISKQWFIKIESLAQKVIDGYKAKDFEIIPDRFNKIFEDWIYNIRDWCISRQLRWGHQIPIWYTDTGEVICAKNHEEAMQKAVQKFGTEVKITQDSDVLDTWFSSALWPFAVLDYDLKKSFDNQDDFIKKFYPASMLETGHDIIFFWVIRMLLFGYEFTEKVPFKKIYFHGLVKDKNGAKMSKSLGNGVDPIDMIEKYGADALRMTLSIGNTPGNDLKFDEKNVENNMMFLNKLWNAARFVHSQSDEKVWKEYNEEILIKNIKENEKNLNAHEKFILQKTSQIIDSTTRGMQKYNFSETGQDLYIFTRNIFCDYTIEEFKNSENTKISNQILVLVLDTILKLWHPYIPFVTEKLRTLLGTAKNDTIISSWPNFYFYFDKKIETEHQIFSNIIRFIRKVRLENNVLPHKTINIKIFAPKQELKSAVQTYAQLIQKFTNTENFEIIDEKTSDLEDYSYGILKNTIEIYVDISNALDVNEEKKKLQSNIEDTKEYIAILDKKLLSESFVRKAPSHIVHSEMQKKAKAVEKLEKLQEKFEKLKKM